MTAGGETAAPVVLLALGATLAGAATLVVGPLALAAYAVLVLALVLLDRAALALVLLLGTTVFLAPDSGLPLAEQAWAPVGPTFSPVEVLLGLAMLAVVLDRARHGYAFRGLGPLRWPVGALAFALAFGGAAGMLDGNGLTAVTGTLRTVLPLVIVPLLVVNVLRDRASLDRAIDVALVALTLQILVVLALYAAGDGASIEDGSVTSLAPGNNLIALLLVCAPVAARLVGSGSRPALDVAGAVALLSLLLSLRRSFYLALVLALAVILVVGLRADTRRLLVPLAVLLGAGLWVGLGSGLVDRVQPSTRSVAGRVAELNPTVISADPQARYRVGERRNVLIELGRHPVAGLGAGGTWAQRVGLSIDQPPELRGYVHNVALYYWMMFGLPGMLAYVWLQVAMVRTGVRVARRDPVPRARAAGLVLAAGIAGLFLAEQTATFTGPFAEMSVLVGALAGLLAALAALEAPDVVVRPRAPRSRALPAAPAPLLGRSSG